MYLLHKGIVHPWLCDVMGHMNVRHYMGMFDDASFQLLAEATGWFPSAKDWQGKGWADVRHEIDYQGELYAGALVEIEGGITKIGNSSFTASFVMKNKMTGEKAATMTAKVVFFDLEARCSMSLTHDIREKMAARQIPGVSNE
jgi:acyl-CoA thioester hydrolase